MMFKRPNTAEGGTGQGGQGRIVLPRAQSCGRPWDQGRARNGPPMPASPHDELVSENVPRERGLDVRLYQS